MFDLEALKLAEWYLACTLGLIAFSFLVLNILNVKRIKINGRQINLSSLTSFLIVYLAVTKEFVQILKGVGRPLAESEQDSIIFNLYCFIAFVFILIPAIIVLKLFLKKGLEVKNDSQSDKQE